jgi:hypothetical protein
MSEPENWRINAAPVTVTGTSLPHGTVQSSRIADGAIQTGNVVDDLRNGDPKLIEALILTALARTSLNGFSDLGKDEARRFLDIYRQHVIEEASRQ